MSKTLYFWGVNHKEVWPLLWWSVLRWYASGYVDLWIWVTNNEAAALLHKV